MSIRSFVAATALIGLVATGCTSIPPGGEPPFAPKSEWPRPDRICVAPVSTFTLVASEHLKGWRPERVFDRLAFQKAVARGIESTGEYQGTPELLGETSAALGPESVKLASVRIDDLALGMKKNGYWAPNLATWLLLGVPAWFVAKEDYTLSFTAHLEVTDGSGKKLLDATFPVRVTGSFDEFDRGFQFFGCVQAHNDEWNWTLVASQLEPAARRVLAERVGSEFKNCP
jgi:hypothetical protein